MSNELGTLTGANNARILDAIRWDASAEYQKRIPAATDAGIDAVLSALTNFRPMFNEFENSLVNRIGLVVGRHKSWTNPLAEFKRGLMKYGSTIEEFQIGLLKAHVYDADKDYMERALLARELPEIQTNYHSLNRENFYKVTVNEAMLRRAFLSEDDGLATFVSGMMNAPITSDNWDEFMLMCRLFREYESHGGFFRVNVPDIADLSSTDSDARKALRVIRALSEDMSFISTRYNAAHMPTFANKADTVLFVTPEFGAALDVEALAASFNIERSNVPNRVIAVPRAQFNIEGCEAILTTKDFFMVADTFMENTSFYNPVGRGTNYFWHHDQIISASRFVPAVMLTTGPGDEVINVSGKIVSIDDIKLFDISGGEIEPTGAAGSESVKVERGMTYQAVAELTTSPADFAGQLGVTWSVTGADSAGTRISQTGVLLVSGSETSETITITAKDSNAVNESANTVSIDLELDTTGDSVPEWPVVRQ